MMQNKNKYIYEGPVMIFDTILTDYWAGETYAVSEKKALSNLAYQFCKQTGRTPNNKITLPGDLDCCE